MCLPARVGLVLLIGAGAGACSILDPTFSEPALIVFYGDTAEISAPDSVGSGATFEVSVPTFAGGCTREIARTQTTIRGTLVEVRLYNETRRANGCTDDLLILTHRVAVHFEGTGLVTIRVLGEQRPFQGTGLRTGPAQLERQVTIY